MREPGIKIVSGGITSQIVARELHEELVMSVGALDPEIPPMSSIRGIDYVTEGVITLNKVIEILRQYNQEDVPIEVFDELAKSNGGRKNRQTQLIDQCTKVNLFVGKAVNEDYSNKNLPLYYGQKKYCTALEDALRALNKNVVLHFY